MPTSRRHPPLAAAHEQRAAPLIQIRLQPMGERLMDGQAGAPEHDDERAEPRSVDAGAGVSHHGDDLRDGRRVGRVALTLLRGERPAWNPDNVAGERGRPAAQEEPAT